MRIISLILIVSLLLPIGCGGGGTEMIKYEGPFYSLEMSSTWHIFDFGGDDLKLPGFYRNATFSKHPMNLKSPADVNEMEYALTCASIFDSSMKLGDFSSLSVPANVLGVKITNREKIVVDGVDVRWLESEVEFDRKMNSSILVDIPLNNGYIQIDFFGPKDDVDLQKEAREIIRSLEISSPEYFFENNQDEPWREGK
ncbi:MAG: hypothetical protein KAH30_04390 [Caldisericia bacterium]|jgi:hypothetical protein|nr:hypothetical protein [Caldisericia bacterium]